MTGSYLEAMIAGGLGTFILVVLGLCALHQRTQKSISDKFGELHKLLCSLLGRPEYWLLSESDLRGALTQFRHTDPNVWFVAGEVWQAYASARSLMKHGEFSAAEQVIEQAKQYLLCLNRAVPEFNSTCAQ